MTRADDRDPHMTTMPIIAYVSQQFPSLTTTFVYREVLALRRAGLTIRPISTWRPRPNTVSQEAAGLIAETFYIFPLRGLKWLGDHLRYLLTRPWRYLSTLARLTLFNRETLANRLRLLIHFGYAARAAAEIEHSQAQHIHADFALNAATVALVAARLTGKPFSFTAHAADIFVNPILLRDKIAAARFVVAISEYNKQYLIKVAGDDKVASKIHVVHCGVDLDEFAPRRQETESATSVVLAVGRLTEKKGFPYLIKACKVLVEQGYRFQCKIVGDGDQKPLLQSLINQNNLSHVVSLEGVVLQEALHRYWDQARIFVLPSIVASNQDRDGIPVVLMEAMALGIPVVSTCVSGIPELIQHEVNGLLVPPGDASALAGAIARVWIDPQLAGRLADQGRITVEQDFDIEKNVRCLANLFERCLQPGPTAVSTLQQNWPVEQPALDSRVGRG